MLYLMWNSSILPKDSEYMLIILSLSLTCTNLIYKTILYFVIYDIGIISCMDICDYLSCYSIYHGHNAPHCMHAFSFESWILVFIYMLYSFLSYMLLLLSIMSSIRLLPRLTCGLSSYSHM